ncbi:MAG TPA: glycosyltransferase family 4 protein, partial [Polyangia bacterium]
PGSRFRIEQWMPVMEKLGASFDYAAFEDEELHRVLYTRGNTVAKAAGMMRGFARRAQSLRSLRQYDAVFIYEEAARMGPAFIEWLIAKAGIPIIYDFCDPIYLHQPSPSNGLWSHLKFVGKTATICRAASHVIVGNEELAQFARQHNSQVTIAPITIDTDEYRPRSWPPDDPSAIPTIGWTGSHSTVPHLDRLRGVLQRLAEKRKFRLKVIGTPNWSAPGVNVHPQAWKAATEVADLEDIDIGVMPLPDDPWIKRRTQLKVRQYMGLAIPAVVSPVGVNTELIQDGENGFLPKTDDEWIERLTLLIDTPALRRKLGAAGRKTIEERYSAKIWGPRILDIIRNAVESRRRRAA